MMTAKPPSTKISNAQFVRSKFKRTVAGLQAMTYDNLPADCLGKYVISESAHILFFEDGLKYVAPHADKRVFYSELEGIRSNDFKTERGLEVVLLLQGGRELTLTFQPKTGKLYEPTEVLRYLQRLMRWFTEG